MAIGDTHEKRILKRIEKHKRLCLRIGRALQLNNLLPRLLRILPLRPEWKIQFDALPRPHLAYGMYVAAMQARALGLQSVTVIEFGVAGGNGLRCMESHAGLIERITEFRSFEFTIVGFDRQGGMPESQDPRDIVYWYELGAFDVDVDTVRSTLKRARYLVGDIVDTLPLLLEPDLPPIGFVAFDVDFYTSTIDALQVFRLQSKTRLPRVLCYLDDVFGISDLTIMGESIGEEAAMHSWNKEHPRKPIEKVAGLRHKRPLPRHWNDQMWCLHDLEHPQYNTGIRQHDESVFIDRELKKAVART